LFHVVAGVQLGFQASEVSDRNMYRHKSRA
jgi:hypothetical protein